MPTDDFSSPSITNLLPALFKVQSELRPIYKDAKNPFLHSSYCSLSAVLETIRPLLLDNGLLIVQRCVPCELGAVCVETRLIHSSGEWLCGTTTIPLPNPDGKSNPGQQAGAAVSYGRRYGIMTMLTLATTDEDTDLEFRQAPPVAKQRQSPPQVQSASPNTSFPCLDGVYYERIQGQDGAVYDVATGKTLPVRKELVAAGFRWNLQERSWKRPA